MPAADFAAAQQRIAARRAQRAASHRAQHNAAHDAAAALSRLPFPLGRLSTASHSVWAAIQGRSGTRPAFRVGQVDAELLDDELVSLLKAQAGDGLKFFGTHLADSYGAELLLALRLALFKLGIWDHSASYGAHLQGLRYTDARSSAPNRPPPTSWQKLAHAAITVGGRYAWTKWGDYLLAATQDYTRPESPRLQLLARLTDLASSAHDVASLISFLVFLVNGRYRTIADRLLRLRLTPTTHATSREVSFEYLNRQLVWHAFTEFLLFLLPLVGIARWRRILSRTWRNLRATLLSLLGRSPQPGGDVPTSKTGELAFLPERTCAICYRNENPTEATEADILAASAASGGVIGSAATDITNPYEAIPCGCIYSFTCLAQCIANEEGEGWTCLRCGELVKQCKPWSGDVLEPVHHTSSSSQPYPEEDRSAMAKSVGFVAASHDDNVALRHVEPVPEVEPNEQQQQQHDQHAHTYPEGDASHLALDDDVSHQRPALDLGGSLFAESSEWARASDGSDTENDPQHSDPHDEDEDEYGAEGEYDDDDDEDDQRRGLGGFD